jgi:hypothetical protein
MNFMELPARKSKRSRWLPVHAMVLGVAVLTLAVFGMADDEVTGKALVSDAYAFTLLFAFAGYYLTLLPLLWKRTEASAAEPWLTLVLMAIVIAYLYFSFRAYFIQPGATGVAVFAQLLVMIYLSCRMD